MVKELKKRILSGFVIGSIILLPGLTGKAELKGTNTKEVCVFNRDNFESDIIGTLKINQEFIKVLSGDNMDLINYHDHLGFINKECILSESDFENNITYDKINKDGFVTTEVNFRVGPGTDYNIISTIKKNSEVLLLAENNNDWYLADYNNNLGFISKEYVKIIDKEKMQEEIFKLPAPYKIIVATTKVNVREEPTIDSPKITTLKKGEKLAVIHKLDNGWYQCLYNNKNVYVCGDYVKQEYAISGNYYKIVFLKNETDVFDYPFGNIIGNLPRYESAFVYGETDIFYYIETEGRVGFLKKSDCESLNNRYIIVDISSQKMTLYDGIDKVISSSIVSGKNSTPTDLGIFSVYNMEKDRTLIGDDYKTFVNYWIGYNHGEGLHDASWRKKFGGNIYEENGSHGCVNLPIKIAKQLYNEVSIGDKVLIKR